mgnify:CR=1 FL=1
MIIPNENQFILNFHPSFLALLYKVSKHPNEKDYVQQLYYFTNMLKIFFKINTLEYL